MNKYTIAALSSAGKDFAGRCFKLLLFVAESSVFVLVREACRC